MKLLTLTARYNSITILVALVFSGVALFFTMRFLVLDELDEQLQAKVQHLEKSIAKDAQNQDFFSTIQLLENQNFEKDIFKDTLIFDEVQQEYEDYRKITATRLIDGNTFKITTVTSRLEWEEFIVIISFTCFACLIFLQVILFFVNQKLNKKIWNPFFKNLETVQGFSIQNKQMPVLIKSNIKEFDEMNTVLLNMFSKLNRDYTILKEFTENASHEIQTPLAIILVGLDELAQAKNLESHTAERLQVLQRTAKRISKLNTNLLLLAKIEHEHFQLENKVEITSLWAHQVNNMEELFLSKNITIKQKIGTAFSININQDLVEIMMSNLISNAYKYSKKNSIIYVTTHLNAIRISNEGYKPLNVNQIFLRFVKDPENQNANGLGLAIVHEICTLHKWQITYAFKNNQHIFTVAF